MVEIIKETKELVSGSVPDINDVMSLVDSSDPKRKELGEKYLKILNERAEISLAILNIAKGTGIKLKNASCLVYNHFNKFIMNIFSLSKESQESIKKKSSYFNNKHLDLSKLPIIEEISEALVFSNLSSNEQQKLLTSYFENLLLNSLTENNYSDSQNFREILSVLNKMTINGAKLSEKILQLTKNKSESENIIYDEENHQLFLENKKNKEVYDILDYDLKHLLRLDLIEISKEDLLLKNASGVSLNAIIKKDTPLSIIKLTDFGQVFYDAVNINIK